MSDYLTERRGLRSWLFTLDHKRIGVMYFWSTLAAFALGGVFAMLIRLALLSPKQTFMTAETYDKVFTLHGAIMIFLFIIPSIPAAFGNFVLPLMLGAKDAALIFVGFNLTFLSQFLLGSRGMPRRYAYYLPQFQPLHVLSTIGSRVLALGLLITLGYLVASLRKRRAAPANP